MVFIAAGVILFSIFAGVVALPLLLRNFQVGDKEADINEIRMAKSAMAEVAIVSLNKMQERLSADVEEKLDSEDINEVATRVIGYLRRRTAGQDEIEHNLLIEDLERRFRLTALRAERGELYHLRATRKISNETLQNLLMDLDLLEAVLIDKEH
ncbi:Na+/H+ antiporter [Providencia rustigianii]|nr:Na+/H+ antiporter [Providencia rustigianii]